MFTLSLVAAMMAPVPAGRIPPLSVAEQVAVRKAVYAKGVVTESPDRDFRSVIIVPEEIAAAHKKNPAATLDLLARITDGAEPFHSMTAASYAIELSVGPDAGLISLWSFMLKPDA